MAQDDESPFEGYEGDVEQNLGSIDSDLDQELDTLFGDGDRKDNEKDDDLDRFMDVLPVNQVGKRQAKIGNTLKKEEKKSSELTKYLVFLFLGAAVFLFIIGPGVDFIEETGLLYQGQGIEPINSELENVFNDSESFPEEFFLLPLDAPVELATAETLQKTFEQQVEQPVPVPAAKDWYVQVGVCSFKECERSITERLQELALPIELGSQKRTYPFITLVSRNQFSKQEAQIIVNTLNNGASRIPKAFLQPAKGKFVISMGLFTTLENAKKIRSYTEDYLKEKKLSFNLGKVNRLGAKTIIYAGPFSDKKAARLVRKNLVDFATFNDAFLVSR